MGGNGLVSGVYEDKNNNTGGPAPHLFLTVFGLYPGGVSAPKMARIFSGSGRGQGVKVGLDRPPSGAAHRLPGRPTRQATAAKDSVSGTAVFMF